MKGNDLDTFAEQNVIVILEGVLATFTYSGRVRKKLRPAAEWEWQQIALRRMAQWHQNNVAVDIVTFESPEAADSAAEFLVQYHYDFGLIEHADFDLFCQSLYVWKPTMVVDTDPGRLNRYGQFGVGAVKGADFG